MLDVGGNSSVASFLRRSFTGSRGSVRALRGSRSPTHVPRGPCAGPSIRKRCGPIVWRGSTRVLEEAGERVHIKESRGKSSVGRAC